MGLFERFRKKKTAVLRIEPGRKSLPETSFLEAVRHLDHSYGLVDPWMPIEVLDLLERFSLVVPDVAQAVRMAVTLGNTGHVLEIEAEEEQRALEAKDALEELARSAWPYAGVDGLVSKMLFDTAVYGSPSLEWVVRQDLRGVERVVIVPHRTIRFRYDAEKDTYRPVQWTGPGAEDYVELNPETYYYAPILQIRNSPYAVPPLLSALPPLVNQFYMTENLRYIMKKVGLLGFVHVMAHAPEPREGESEEAYRQRATEELRRLAQDFLENFRDGLAISYDDVEIQHFNVAGSVQGADKLFQLNEEQVASGLDVDPAMLGRTYSTTETYAGVVYQKLVKRLDLMRQIVRRGIEKGYLLHLRLLGIPVKDVNVRFKPNAKLRPKEDAEMALLEAQRLATLVSAGILDPEEARQKLGYPPLPPLPEEGETGSPRSTERSPGQIRFTFRFQEGRYRWAGG